MRMAEALPGLTHLPMRRCSNKQVETSLEARAMLGTLSLAPAPALGPTISTSPSPMACEKAKQMENLPGMGRVSLDPVGRRPHPTTK